MLENIKKRYQEQGAPMPPQEVILEQVQERLIIEELQLQMGRQAGIRVGDGELNQAFEKALAIDGIYIGICKKMNSSLETNEFFADRAEFFRSAVIGHDLKRISQEFRFFENKLQGV